MYTDRYFADIRRITRIRVALFLVLAAVLAAPVVFFISIENQLGTCTLSAAAFIISYFVWSFKVSPYTRYNRFLKDVQTGRKRETACEFKYFTPETRIHDGVEVHDLIVMVGAEEEDERLFYWDTDMPAPQCAEGEKITVVSYGNFVVELKKEKAEQ